MRKGNDFQGTFAVHLKNFLDEKRALGYKYIEQERCLHEFDSLSLQYDCSGGLPKELVMAYVEKKPHWSQSTQRHKVMTARNIALYLQKYGLSVYCGSVEFPMGDEKTGGSAILALIQSSLTVITLYFSWILSRNSIRFLQRKSTSPKLIIT